MSEMNTAATAGFGNAEAYEQGMGRWSRLLAPLLIRFGGLADGDCVLDVGCGTGSLTFTLPEIANVANVTGIDLTDPFVEFARGRKPIPASASRQPMPVLCRSRTIRSPRWNRVPFLAPPGPCRATGMASWSGFSTVT